MAEDSRRCMSALATALMVTIQGYQRARPQDRDTTLEVLGALAFTAGAILRGTGRAFKRERSDFFDSVDEAVREQGGPLVPS